MKKSILLLLSVLLILNCGIGHKVNPLLEPPDNPIYTELNWQCGDVLCGEKPSSWTLKNLWIKIPEYIIKFVTDSDVTHVMIACYPNPEPEYAGEWIVADCSFAHGISWQSVDKLPSGYTLHRNPYGFVFTELSMYDAIKDDIGKYYDVLELIQYLKRDDDFPKGISDDMFTCASWIQHVMKDQGFVPFPDRAATPEYFHQWPEVASRKALEMQ